MQARNLLRAGYEVIVWNRSTEKCELLAAEGAAVALTPAKAAAAADITIAILADPPVALAIAREAAGGLCGGAASSSSKTLPTLCAACMKAAVMHAGKAYIDASTVDAQTAQQVAQVLNSLTLPPEEHKVSIQQRAQPQKRAHTHAQLVHGAGAQYLEAPVSGTKGPAEQGKLMFLTSGDRALFERAAPLLDVMGKASFFLGEVRSCMPLSCTPGTSRLASLLSPRVGEGPCRLTVYTGRET